MQDPELVMNELYKEACFAFECWHYEMFESVDPDIEMLELYEQVYNYLVEEHRAMAEKVLGGD